ncbi:hypothetical protein NBCG_01575 [Nocardioidaceae bacterium Broad-1]|nr:hypothetical protein NBCG_01575 [Nocardioidaceae bacterium Broad-1]
MAVIALASATGSPGVTTTALGLAMSWPRPVLLVEADPSGASGLLVGFFRGAWGYESGLVELALAPEGVAAALPQVTQRIGDSTVSFIAGTRSHTQAAGLRGLWDPLATSLADLEESGQDVIIDAGRLGIVGSPEPLLSTADLSLLVCRTSLPAVVGARSWATAAKNPGSGWRQPYALLIGEGQPYHRAEVTKVLGLPVLASIPNDGDAAAVYHQGAQPPHRFETGAYVRGLLAAVEAIQATITRTRVGLMEGATT